MEKSLFQYVTRNCCHRYIKFPRIKYAVREYVWNKRLDVFRSVYILIVRVIFFRENRQGLL